MRRNLAQGRRGLFLQRFQPEGLSALWAKQALQVNAEAQQALGKKID